MKGKGGLGFRDLEAFNLALLAKQVWRLLVGDDSLFYKVFKAKYFPNSSFLKAKHKTKASWTWQSIWASRVMVEKGWRWVVATGSQVDIWKDPWLDDPLCSKGLTVNPSNCGRKDGME